MESDVSRAARCAIDGEVVHVRAFLGRTRAAMWPDTHDISIFLMRFEHRLLKIVAECVIRNPPGDQSTLPWTGNATKTIGEVFVCEVESDEGLNGLT